MTPPFDQKKWDILVSKHAGSVCLKDRTAKCLLKAAVDLRALMKISTALGSVRGLQALEQKLLEALSEITPADRGAVILVGRIATRARFRSGAPHAALCLLSQHPSLDP